MFLITVRAYSDYAISYNIPVIVVGNYKKSNEIINILNSFSKNHNQNGEDKKLSEVLKDNLLYKELNDLLNQKISKYDTDIIIKKLTDICKNNDVFVYDDIFNILEVVEL